MYITYYTKILELNLFAFAYRLFHEDFSPIDGAHIFILSLLSLLPVIYNCVSASESVVAIKPKANESFIWLTNYFGIEQDHCLQLINYFPCFPTFLKIFHNQFT